MSLPALYAVPKPEPTISGPAIVRETVTAIAEAHGVTVGQILRKDKSDRISAIRFEVYAALRALRLSNGLPPSYPAIGRWMQRDHATIIHGVRVHAAKLAEAA